MATDRRVLIIEDNHDTADSLRLLLEVVGHKVRVAATGPEGVQAADDWRPDVVVCDIGLPELDGYGVARELRRRAVSPPAKLIAVTAYGTEEDQAKARAAGFQYHLTKPADPALLLKLVGG